MTTLSNILTGLKVISQQGDTHVQVTSIAFDSRRVSAGSVFVAVVGTTIDGHQYVAQAIADGAVAIVCQQLPAQLASNVAYVKVQNSAVALGLLASNFYQNPSAQLKLVGVTGTNGKTTVATLLYQLFTGLGYKCGLLSTVENQINGKVIPATHTTPDPVSLNQLLSQMVALGCDYCFMEVSSHAVAQHRIEGLVFAGGVFTNLTHDHLDYHKTFENYLQAKKAFFDGLPKTAFALTNADDKNGLVMQQNTQAARKSYALKTMATYRARMVENLFDGLHLHFDGQEVWFKMVGSFNAYNLLAVYGAAMLLGQNKQDVLTLLSALKGAEGRFDYIVAPNKIVGIVDYAHTPDAVQNVLNTIHDIRKADEKIITVLGCGGDRDKTKRPVMARVAAQLSDKVILTSDNPRSENPQQIIADMQTGLDVAGQAKTMSITDRREAIKTAFHLASSGDIILLAGKGHEKYQEIKGERKHFDDKEELQQLFATIK